jgi:hypothetical protein
MRGEDQGLRLKNPRQLNSNNVGGFIMQKWQDLSPLNTSPGAN